MPTYVRSALEHLQPVFVLSRYPSDDESQPIPLRMFWEAEALSYISAGQEVLAWVELILLRDEGGVE